MDQLFREAGEAAGALTETALRHPAADAALDAGEAFATTILLGALAAGLTLMLALMVRRLRDRRDRRTAARAPRPIDFCIREGAGSRQYPTSLTIETDYCPPIQINNLHPITAARAVNWWRDPDTRNAPGSTLWWQRGPIRVLALMEGHPCVDDETAWVNQYAIDVQAIKAMRTQTKREPTESSEAYRPDATDETQPAAAVQEITGTDPDVDPFPTYAGTKEEEDKS